MRHSTLIIFFILVDDCADLSCGENEVCERVGNTFDCVCHQDYEGEDCQQKGQYT